MVGRFCLLLSASSIKNSLSELANFDIENSSFSLDKVTERLQNILLNAAYKSLKKNKTKSHSNKTRNKPWYDNNLQYFKKRMINNARIMSQFPRDPVIRGRFFKLRKQYAKLCKYKRNQYKQSMIDKLDTLNDNNPRAYWNLVNSLLDVKKRTTDSTLHPSQWLDHFIELNKVNESYSNRINQLQNKVSLLEKRQHFNELDFLITSTEISQAISNLKCNKSPGLDNIKHGHNALLPALKNIFNASLSYGLYPKAWAEGYITVLHKNGDINNTNNYRGITITNAVGKLFTKDLTHFYRKIISLMTVK